MQEHLCVGTVTKPQGIKGEVKVLPATDDIGRFLKLRDVYLKQEGKLTKAKVESARVDSSFAYLKLLGVDDMSGAELLRGAEVLVDRKNAVRLPKGRWFIADLIGCEVLDGSGNRLGELKDVLQAGGNDVYVVKRERGTLMFPAIKALLTDVNIQERRITVDEKRLAEVAVYED